MKPIFLEVASLPGSRKTIVNINNITHVMPFSENSHIYTNAGEDSIISVRENYDELVNRITTLVDAAEQHK